MIINLQNICIDYIGLKDAIKDISFSVSNSEFLVLCGIIGSGKTTILRTICGLEKINTGGIKFNNTTAKDIFFSNGLGFFYNNKSICKNLSYGLKFRKIRKDDILKEITAAQEFFDINLCLSKKVKQLTNTEKFILSLLRAYMRKAKIMLFDEPFLGLNKDEKTKCVHMLKQLTQELNCATILATSDFDDCKLLNENTAILKHGQILQLASLDEITINPANEFIKQFCK